MTKWSVTCLAKIAGCAFLLLSLSVAASAREQFPDSPSDFVGTRESCDTVKKIARSQQEMYRDGGTDADLIDRLGGINVILPYEWKIMSYVGQYKYNETISPEKVAGLAYQNCMAGVFDE